MKGAGFCPTIIADGEYRYVENKREAWQVLGKVVDVALVVVDVHSQVSSERDTGLVAVELRSAAQGVSGVGGVQEGKEEEVWEISSSYAQT